MKSVELPPGSFRFLDEIGRTSARFFSLQSRALLPNSAAPHTDASGWRSITALSDQRWDPSLRVGAVCA